jgi:DNA-binding response OmpR family regulator
MPSSLSIAVVEDHDFLRDSTVNLLRDRGYHTEGFYCAEDLLEDNKRNRPDLYIIDLNLPGEDGLSLAKRIRTTRADVAIVMVTARGHVQDKVQGYASGADIYLPKPVDPEELLAVVDRFSLKFMNDRALTGDANFYFSKLLLEKDGQQVQLTQSEGNLLNSFLMAPSQILERWQVMEVMTIKGEPISDASMEVRIGTLRKKFVSIGVTATSIQSIRKLGYRLCLTIISK